MKRRLGFALAALVPLALFLAIREVASRRPQVLASVGISNPTLLFSPDSRYLIIQEGHLKAGDLWDMSTRRRVRQLPKGRYYSFSSDSRALAVINDNQGLTFDGKGVTYAPGARLFDLESGRSIQVVHAPKHFTDNWTLDAAFSPRGELILTTARSFYRFNTTGQLLHRAVPQTAFDSPPEVASAQKIAPDGIHVLATDKIVRLHDISTGHIRHSLRSPAKGSPALRSPNFSPELVGWSPDGALVWEANTQLIRFWNARTGKLARQWKTKNLFGAHFTPDSKHLAVVQGNRLELQEVLTGKVVKTLPGPRAEPFQIAPDGSFAVSIENGQLLRWRLR
jgi:WD40 repeat protein